MKNVLVINGPNLNLLGVRQPEVYGALTLSELETKIEGWGKENGITTNLFQANHEGAIIDALHAARGAADGIVINPGAFSHYSYAIHDAIIATELPAVEIHISNIHAREPWRRVSVTAPACDYVIYGRGIRGYRDALTRLVNTSTFPVKRIDYGDAPDQFGELRTPSRPGPHPVAVLLHGGFWRDPWTVDLMDQLAIDLVQRDWAAFNLEYRRLGNGGGFPVTLEDAANGIDALRSIAEEYALDLNRVATIGHAAGGQLALWLAARPQLYDGQPNTPDRLMPVTVVALAALSDLEQAQRLKLGSGAVDELLFGPTTDDRSLYALTSPRELLPLGIRQVVVHGVEDDIVPFAMSSEYAATAQNAGDEVELVKAEGLHHFGIIEPRSTAWADAISGLTT